MKRTLFTIGLTCVSLHILCAQPLIGLRNFGNTNEYLIGGKIGYRGTKIPLEGYVFYDVRPFEKRVFVDIMRPLRLQLREKRHFVGFGAEYTLTAENKVVGGFALLNLAYTWANYSGTALEPEESIVLIPGLGLNFNFSRNTNLKLGYSYYRSQSLDVENGKIYLGITTYLSN